MHVLFCSAVAISSWPFESIIQELVIVFQAEHVVPAIIVRHADRISAPVGFDSLNRSLCEDPAAI